MTVQPKHARFDPVAVLCEALSTPRHAVVADRDATYRPHELVTVVQAPIFQPAGSLPGNRFLFDVSVVLSTTGPDVDTVMDAAEDVADRMLSMTEVGGVFVSSVRCDSEPARVSPHMPSGAEVVTSRWSMMMRRKHV